MGYTEKLPTGRWKGTYRTPNGRERSKTFDRKIDAQRFLAQVETSKLTGQWVEPSLGRLRFEDWVAEVWPALTLELAPSTRLRDEGILRNHITRTFGPMPLASITQPHVRGWIADIAAIGLAPNTVHKAYQILSKLLSAAVDAGRLTQTPCRNVPLPKVIDHEMRFLAPDEVARLAAVVHPRYRALVLLGAYGGLRIGELGGLRRARVDVLRGRIDIAEKVVEVGGQLLFGAPKTRAGRRQVPLPRPVTAELEAHLAQFVSPSGDALVFTGPDGGALRARQFRARRWLPAVDSAGLAPLRPHDLRHTAVARWIADGASPKQIATWAGHTSVSVVLDRYGHLFPGHEADVLARSEAAYVAPDEASATVIPISSAEISRPARGLDVDRRPREGAENML